jgi:hypothetical protein
VVERVTQIWVDGVVRRRKNQSRMHDDVDVLLLGFMVVTLLAILYNITKCHVCCYKWLKKILVIENTKDIVRNKN